MIRRLAMLAGLAALAGCARHPAGSPQAACHSAAYRDPKVKLIINKGLGGLNNYQVASQDMLRRAVDEAYQRCLAARGLPSAGGVELPRPEVEPFNPGGGGS